MYTAFTFSELNLWVSFIILIPIIIYVKYNIGGIRKVMKELGLSMGWDYRNPIFGHTTLKGVYNGVDVLITYYPGSKHSRRYFGIELDIQSMFDIRISKENFMHKLGKKTGLAKEIETGDQQFDEKYFLKASNSYNAELFMRKSQVRQAVTSIVDTGFSIDMDNRKIKLIASVNYSKLADMFILQNVLDNAYRLIKELP
jgi:hypothetical protein